MSMTACTVGGERVRRLADDVIAAQRREFAEVDWFDPGHREEWTCDDVSRGC
ncbi:hypothetical protein [Actinotalea sp.]|uniref:hypothetical protein n=1 Tax=Actinotalea sp. TaxID=1872145 RepID=UPI003563F2D7